MGRLPKDPDRAQGHRPHIGLVRGAAGADPPKKALPPPPPAFGWLKETREAWRDFWTSRSSELVDRLTDLTSIRHLFTLYDERARAYAAYARNRLVKGSKGQKVANPVYKVARSIQNEIRQLEQQFGIGARSRRALGMTVGDEPTLEEMNRDLEADFTDPRDLDAPKARNARRGQ